jgi:hypothetical protein
MTVAELKATITEVHATLTAFTDRRDYPPEYPERHDHWRDAALAAIAYVEENFPHAFCVNEWQVWPPFNVEAMSQDMVDWLKENVRGGYWYGDIMDEWSVVAFADPKEAVHFKLRWA